MPANRDFRIFFLTVQEPVLIRLYFAFGLASIQTYEEKTLAHRLTGLTRIMKNILFCCWNPSSLGYAVARKTQQQKESSPLARRSYQRSLAGRYLQKNCLSAMPHGDGICLPASYCWQAKRKSICVNLCDQWAILCFFHFQIFHGKLS